MKALVWVSLLLAHCAVTAQTYGDWVVSKDNTGLPYMATTNDSNGVFGKWCDGETEKCFWVMATSTRCEQNAEFPALITTPLGAVTTKLICGGPRLIGKSTYYRLLIADFDLMTRITLEGTGRIGIAIATEDGNFRVSRFSLSGGAAASARMDQAEAEFVRTKQQRTTRDRVL